MKIRRVPVDRLVFLDESGMKLSMSRSHAWVQRGEELIDRVPMNWPAPGVLHAVATRPSRRTPKRASEKAGRAR